MRVRSLSIAAALVGTFGSLTVAFTTPASAVTPKLSSYVFASLFVDIGPGDQPAIDWSRSNYSKVYEPAPVTIARKDVGTYRITLDRVVARHAMVNLTTVNVPGEAGNDPICNVKSISVLSTSTRVTVNCFDPVTAKRAPGAHFVVLFTNTDPFDIQAAPANLVYLRTDSSTSTHKPVNRFRSAGSDRVKVQHVATGIYRVTVPKAGWSFIDGNVVTTAISSSARWCNPTEWGPAASTPDDLVIEVHCFKPGGQPANSRFALIATRTSQLDIGWAPAAAQLVALGNSNGPDAQLLWTYNSANAANVASYSTIKNVTVLTMPGLPFSVPGTRSLLVGAVGEGRCAISLTTFISLVRYAVARCQDGQGVAVKARVVMMDADIPWCVLC